VSVSRQCLYDYFIHISFYIFFTHVLHVSLQGFIYDSARSLVVRRVSPGATNSKVDMILRLWVQIMMFQICDSYALIIFYLTNKNITFQLCRYLQSLISSVLKTVVLPYLNLQLKNGFPLPTIEGYGFQNTIILYNYPWISVCSDVSFIDEDYYLIQHSTYVS
jgi:hypothetical protein